MKEKKWETMGNHSLWREGSCFTLQSLNEQVFLASFGLDPLLFHIHFIFYFLGRMFHMHSLDVSKHDWAQKVTCLVVFNEVQIWFYFFFLKK